MCPLREGSVCISHSALSNASATPWAVAHRAGSGLLFPPPGALPDPGMEPGSPALHSDSLLSEPL